MISKASAVSTCLLSIAISSHFAGSVNAQRLVIAGGNGQVVLEQFPATLPFTVRAEDALGRPLAGVALSWDQIPVIGSLRNTETITDASGLAASNFVASNVVPGNSYTQATIRVTSTLGAVDFVVTITQTRTVSGSLAPPPLVELLAPPLETRSLDGPPGGTLRAAVSVRLIAQSGGQQGQPVPNIGMRLVHDSDATLPAAATCVGPNGLVLSDSNGIATCDVVLSRTPGDSKIRVAVGEYALTPPVDVRISGAPACTFTLAPGSLSFGASGGQGTFQVATGAGCNWTAVSDAPWLAPATPAGSGSGIVSFNVFSNAGPARSGGITVGGQRFSVTQAGAGVASGLAITTGALLPVARTGQLYSVFLGATGGTGPYTWSATAALPAWLTLNAASGELRGTPSVLETVGLAAQVTDAVGARASQSFTLTVTPVSGGGGFAITNSAFPNGATGAAYRQRLTVTGRCGTIFPRPVVFTVTSGALPDGLAIGPDSTNVYEISGVPRLAGNFRFTLLATDPCGVTATASYSIQIGGPGSAPPPAPGPTPTVLLATPAAISIRTRQGVGSLSGSQTVSVTSAGAAVAFTASITGQSVAFLTIIGPAGGSTPGSLIVGVTNASSLAAGFYPGSVTVTVVGSGQTLTIPVTVTVDPPPKLTAAPPQLSFRTMTGAGAVAQAQQTIEIATEDVASQFTTVPNASWLFTSAPAGQTPASVVVRVDTSGLGPGTYLSSVTVLATGSSGPVTVPVSVIVSAPPPLAASPGQLSFTFRQGDAPPGAQQIAINSGGVAQNFTVSINTGTSGNWLVAAPLAGVTPAVVTFQVTAAGMSPGTYQGSVRITPASGEVIIVAVTLVVGQPAPSLIAVVNAASFLSGGVAAGEIVTLFGNFLGPAQAAGPRLTASGMIDSVTAECRVLFDGVPAPILYASAGQVTAIAPFSLAGRFRTRVEVEFQGRRSNPFDLAVLEAAPGIFADADGNAAAVNEDGSINTAGTAAGAGTVVSFYATGGGTMNPSPADGEIIGETLPLLVSPPIAEIDGAEAEVLYAGGAPGLPAGALQINLRIPEGSKAGALAVVLRIAGSRSQPGVVIWVR